MGGSIDTELNEFAVQPGRSPVAKHTRAWGNSFASIVTLSPPPRGHIR